MTEEEKDQKNKKLGIVALATAVLSWGCVIGAIPFGVFAWFPLLAVSTVTSVLSRKTVLGKTAIVLLILEIPGYLALHFVSMAPAS
jgi:dolichyl-phosphate-mannose--protein O-mannosyl transferase